MQNAYDTATEINRRVESYGFGLSAELLEAFANELPAFANNEEAATFLDALSAALTMTAEDLRYSE